MLYLNWKEISIAVKLLNVITVRKLEFLKKIMFHFLFQELKEILTNYYETEVNRVKNSLSSTELFHFQSQTRMQQWYLTAWTRSNRWLTRMYWLLSIIGSKWSLRTLLSSWPYLALTLFWSISGRFVLKKIWGLRCSNFLT